MKEGKSDCDYVHHGKKLFRSEKEDFMGFYVRHSYEKSISFRDFVQM